jgi:predicted nucleic acid-binding protein
MVPVINSDTVAICDSCVLYDSTTRDFLMRFAVNDLFFMKWSQDIENEWIYSLLLKRTDLYRERLERTARMMREAILDSMVIDYEKHIELLNLPDQNDRHVLAAAIESNAEYIVTVNVDDFPELELSKYKVKTIRPDIFLSGLAKSYPFAFQKIAEDILSACRKPKLSKADLIEKMKKVGLKVTAKLLLTTE